MIQSILTYLDGRSDPRPTIALSVMLARRHGARLRGLTVSDTRLAHSLTTTCEAAAYSVIEQERLERSAARQAVAQTAFAQACLDEEVNFDVRRSIGSPLELLPFEARYHDLAITGWRDSPAAWQSEDGHTRDPHFLVDLLLAGVQPLLILRDRDLVQQPPRVLLVNDGSIAAVRTIRHFLNQRLWPDASLRLLTVAPQEDEARRLLRESADLCRGEYAARDCETGFACGPLRKVLLPYAEKWSADLIVLGVSRSNGLLRRVWGAAAVDVLSHSSIAMYLGG